MRNLFLKHPRSVNETYLTHAFRSLNLFFILLGLSFKILIHAIFPFLYEYVVSERIKKLNEILQKKKQK